MSAAIRSWGALALIAGALAVVATGCGGGETTTASGEELTKSELIAQGDAICKQAHDEFSQLQENPPTTAEDAASYTQRLVDISAQELASLQELNAPADLEPDLDSYLKALEKNLTVLKQGLTAAQQEDAQAYAKAQAKAVSGQVDRLRLAQAVGFTECSRPAGTAPSSAG